MNVDVFSICTKAIPVDSANLMSIFKRYHNLVRRAYHIIKKETPDTNDYPALQMTSKEVN